MSVRQQKLESRIHRLVSEALLRDVDDPRVRGLATVTRVKVSPDLREARVYISILGDGPPGTAMAGLKSAGSIIQRRVADGVAMKFAPKLSFELDQSLKKQAEILRIIDQTAAETPAPKVSPPPSG